MEIWKDVINYEGLYQVSSFGSVKSLKFGKERILKNSVDGAGYASIDFRKDGIRKAHRPHQLVAVHFLNHVINGHKLVVNHINLDRLDNRVENLEVITTRQNTTKSHLTSTSKYTGVFWHKRARKWQASISINHISVYLGLYDCEIEASQAYQDKLKMINK